MSSRPLFRPEKVANAISMTTTATSSPSNINMVSTIGYTVSWTNGSLGAFTVEVSNDYVPTPPGVVPALPASGTWVTLPLSSAIASAGTADTAYADIVGVSAAWIRMRFTHASGSGGTWTAVVAGKVL